MRVIKTGSFIEEEKYENPCIEERKCQSESDRSEGIGVRQFNGAIRRSSGELFAEILDDHFNEENKELVPAVKNDQNHILLEPFLRKVRLAARASRLPV